MSFEHFSAPLSRVMHQAQKGLAFDDFSRCESPIEALLQLALASISRHVDIRWCPAQTLDELNQCALPPGITVGSQVWAGDYRLDFAFMKARGGPVLGVECDGKQFHHGSRFAIRADAERDMQLSERNGVKVLRLRGDDICRTPLGAVNECLLALEGETRIRTLHLAFRQAKPISERHYKAVERYAQTGKHRQLSSAARDLTEYRGPTSARWQHCRYDLTT